VPAPDAVLAPVSFSSPVPDWSIVAPPVVPFKSSTLSLVSPVPVYFSVPVVVNGNMFRIDGQNADAHGKQVSFPEWGLCGGGTLGGEEGTHLMAIKQRVLRGGTGSCSRHGRKAAYPAIGQVRRGAGP
jgi:hypothetical protein